MMRRKPLSSFFSCLFLNRVFIFFHVFFRHPFFWSVFYGATPTQTDPDGPEWTWLLCFPFWQSSFIKLFDVGLQYEFIRTFLFIKSKRLEAFFLIDMDILISNKALFWAKLDELFIHQKRKETPSVQIYTQFQIWFKNATNIF